jgi:hypothetical protein
MKYQLDLYNLQKELYHNLLYAAILHQTMNKKLNLLDHQVEHLTKLQKYPMVILFLKRIPQYLRVHFPKQQDQKAEK